MSLLYDVVKRVARALNRDGHCWRCADYPNARHSSECINAAVSELSKTHDNSIITVLQIEAGQIWKFFRDDGIMERLVVIHVDDLGNVYIIDRCGHESTLSESAFRGMIMLYRAQLYYLD